MSVNDTKNGRFAARRRFVKRAGALAAGSLLAGVPMQLFAQAQGYPSKPVRVLLGYPPGGSADVMTRLIAEYVGTGLKQTFYVENKPGASGNIATQQALQSPADGYTLLFGNPAELVINKFTMKEMGFNPDKDFVPVVRVFNIPLALVVPAKSPYQKLEDLVADAKRNPGKLSFASAGGGSPGHLAAEALAFKAKASMTHVPYKGAGPALTDVIGGHVDLYFAGITAVAQHVKAGTIRVLAVSSEKRSPFMPDVPTVAEVMKLPGFDFTLWGGLMAPAGTPPEIVALLNHEANKAYARPEVKARLATEYSEAVLNTPEEFGAFIRAQHDKYAEIIKDIKYTGQ